MRNFGEFFNDQVANADLIVMSRTDTASEEKVVAATEILKGLNPNAKLITTPWDKLSGAQIREAMEHDALHEEMEKLRHEHHHHHDHDEDECDDPECECHHHHDHDEDEEHEHHHHHHEDGEECDDPECECHHHHDHDGHHHHHADEVFASWGMETPRKYSEAELREILGALSNAVEYGIVLRAKGIVDASDGEWLYFDYVPGEMEIRRGAAGVTGRFCVIGSHIREDALKELFTGE
jgi:G3E family GTPase